MHFFPRFVSTLGGNLAGLTGFALAIALAGVETAQAQVPEVGVWINHEGKGAVEIKQCGPALCGNIVWLRTQVNDQGQPLFDRRNPDESKRTRPICGLPVIGNVKRTSEGWDEGWIYNPEEGAQFDVALKASGDKLIVTGYKGIKLFSKTLTWTRAPADLQRCEGAGPQTKAKPPGPALAAPLSAAKAAAPSQAKKPAATNAAPAPGTTKPATTAKATDQLATKKATAAAPGAAKAKAPAAKPTASTPTTASADKSASPKAAKAAAAGQDTASAKTTAKKPVTTAATKKAGDVSPEAKAAAAKKAAAKKKTAEGNNAPPAVD